MRAWTIGAMAMLGATVFGCDEAHDCTADLRQAVAITVVVPAGATVDEVTARKDDGETWVLSNSNEPDGGPSLEYGISEQGAGTYTITVTSGSETRTAIVNVEEDDCHAILEEVTIDFTTPAS